MAEVFVQFSEPVMARDGRVFVARACGAEMDRHLWQGWLEFLPADGGAAIRSRRETTQPNRQDTEYWATGLTPVYLEGSLRRALRPVERQITPEEEPPYFDEPADPFVVVSNGTEAVLDPFSVYQKGEALLRRQLSALAGWHLVNIIRKYELSSSDPEQLEATEPAALVETIIAGVRQQLARR